MKPNEMKLSDIQRILIGEVPAEFYIELVIRALFVYLILIISMRLMGKRMSSQLGRNELAALVSLAAAVGVPMMNPDRGLLPIVLISAIIILFQVIISSWSIHSEKFEQLTQDDLSILVNNGVMNLKEMKKSRISGQRLISQLRSLAIPHLGLVSKLYLEANGSFSLVERKETVPGLSLFPDWDVDYIQKILKPANNIVCLKCGNIEELGWENTRCYHCNAEDWGTAYHVRD